MSVQSLLGFVIARRYSAVTI